MTMNSFQVFNYFILIFKIFVKNVLNKQNLFFTNDGIYEEKYQDCD